MSVLLRENHQLSRRGGNEVWGGSQNWFMPLFSWQNLFLFIETFIKPSMKRKQFLWRGRRKMPTKKIRMSALRARVRWNCWNSPNKVLNEYMHWNQVSFSLSTVWNSGHIHLLFCCFLAVLFLQLHVPSWGRRRDTGFYRSEELAGWLWLYFQLAEVFLLSLYVSVCSVIFIWHVRICGCVQSFHTSGSDVQNTTRVAGAQSCNTASWSHLIVALLQVDLDWVVKGRVFDNETENYKKESLIKIHRLSRICPFY